MSKLVERVAFAIAPLIMSHYEYGLSHSDARRFARAAIAAMREPIEAMIDVALEGYPEPDELDRIDKREQWRAQIDVALSEEVRT